MKIENFLKQILSFVNENLFIQEKIESSIIKLLEYPSEKLKAVDILYEIKKNDDWAGKLFFRSALEMLPLIIHDVANSNRGAYKIQESFSALFKKILEYGNEKFFEKAVSTSVAMATSRDKKYGPLPEFHQEDSYSENKSRHKELNKIIEITEEFLDEEDNGSYLRGPVSNIHFLLITEEKRLFEAINKKEI